ncbi:hypothetical protein GALMADRAFT_249697 [Galerina marginata CBS 339.88]|uniref:Uncharacterized protein n=1 Tax=Galerina marginata (strain CBS 339.88) TaxID=685588 RepID=A0A067SXM7_GALM3|nr:hypothetical protein GALMADRAFT_249697 [Galerina marginata CBS 339.88]
MFGLVKLFVCITTLVSTGATGQLIQNPLYIIRNAETDPASGNLSTTGLARASNCLPNVFSKNSQYDIGLIISCKGDSKTSPCQATLKTTMPLAESLGLSIDSTCDSTGETASQYCLKQLMLNFSSSSSKSILLVWDENHFKTLRDEFGLRNLPRDQPDAIFTLRNGIFVSQTSQNCPGIDFPTADSTQNGVPSPPTTGVTGLTSSQWDALVSNLYYTTTLTISAPNPTGTAMLLRRSEKAGGLNAKPPFSHYSHFTRKIFRKYSGRL